MSLNSLTAFSWDQITNDEAFMAETAKSTALMFFAIADCFTCGRVAHALNNVPAVAFPKRRFVVVFHELNPHHIAWMRRLRVAATPQLRLYRHGALIAGAQGIDPSFDDAALVQWIVDWLSANAGVATGSQTGCGEEPK
jgi:hypothetical protein